MSRYSAVKTGKEDFQIFVLKDSASCSTAEIVPEIGNNVYRFECAGRQVLKPPESLKSLRGEPFGAYRYGHPILSPPNRVKHGKLSFRGKSYQLPLNEPPHHLHGTIGREGWEVLDYGSSGDQGAYVTSRFRYASHPEILGYFPHPLSFTFTTRLKEGRLLIEGTVLNEGEDEAPFALGLHPYFPLPYESGERMEITVPAAGEWPVSRQAFVTGPPSVTAFSQRLNEGVDLGDFQPLDCSLISLSPGERICRIALKDSGYTIAYRFDEQFPFVVLFRPDWSSAFSLEPYTCVTDAFNLPYEPQLTGARSLQAGEKAHFETSMWVESEGGSAGV